MSTVLNEIRSNENITHRTSRYFDMLSTNEANDALYSPKVLEEISDIVRGCFVCQSLNTSFKLRNIYFLIKSRNWSKHVFESLWQRTESHSEAKLTDYLNKLYSNSIPAHIRDGCDLWTRHPQKADTLLSVLRPQWWLSHTTDWLIRTSNCSRNRVRQRREQKPPKWSWVSCHRGEILMTTFARIVWLSASPGVGWRPKTSFQPGSLCVRSNSNVPHLTQLSTAVSSSNRVWDNIYCNSVSSCEPNPICIAISLLFANLISPDLLSTK